MRLVQFRNPRHGDVLAVLPDRWQDDDLELLLQQRGVNFSVQYVRSIQLFDGDLNLKEGVVFKEVRHE